jgi:hypothetical protein
MPTWTIRSGCATLPLGARDAVVPHLPPDADTRLALHRDTFGDGSSRRRAWMSGVGCVERHPDRERRPTRLKASRKPQGPVDLGNRRCRLTFVACRGFLFVEHQETPKLTFERALHPPRRLIYSIETDESMLPTRSSDAQFAADRAVNWRSEPARSAPSPERSFWRAQNDPSSGPRGNGSSLVRIGRDIRDRHFGGSVGAGKFKL